MQRSFVKFFRSVLAIQNNNNNNRNSLKQIGQLYWHLVDALGEVISFKDVEQDDCSSLLESCIQFGTLKPNF